MVAEALTNVAKHPGDATVEVEVATADGRVRWGYAMTGGGADPARGSLVGLRDRVEAQTQLIRG